MKHTLLLSDEDFKITEETLSLISLRLRRTDKVGFANAETASGITNYYNYYRWYRWSERRHMVRTWMDEAECASAGGRDSEGSPPPHPRTRAALEHGGERGEGGSAQSGGKGVSDFPFVVEDDYEMKKKVNVTRRCRCHFGRNSDLFIVKKLIFPIADVQNSDLMMKYILESSLLIYLLRCYAIL